MINDGKIVAFPTDTVFGLGVDPESDEAVKRLFALKRRALDNPIPLMIAGIEDLPKVATAVPEIAEKLMSRYWPGALTLILPKAPAVSQLVSWGKDTIAVRIPAHPVALKLLRLFGRPLAVTSANLSGQNAAVSTDEIRANFGNSLSFIVPGEVEHGISSTVVDCTREPPVILRRGVLKIDFA